MAFGGKLAEVYDLIYQDKEYEKECDFLDDVFNNYSPKQVNTILDLGCGTGGHAILLAKRGYKVTGIDSSPAMIRRAKEKSERANLSLNFQVMSISQINLNTKFDACLCMFAVMNYITQTEEILESLKNIRKHLNKNSLFVFDFWNGLAVLRTLPSVTVKTVGDKEKRIIRIAQPELDAFNHLCRVCYHLLVTQDNRLIDEIKETHVIRYLFPQEITHYLEDAGFEVLRICPFPDLNGKVDENIWNIAVIARAIGADDLYL